MMRRYHMLGEFGDRFGPHGLPLGAVGQYTQLSHALTATGDCHSSDRFYWPVDDLNVAPVIDWADGDGVNPFVGPVLTATGAPTAGQPTPWTRLCGTDTTETVFAANEHYRTATLVNPTLGQDMVIIHLGQMSNDGLGVMMSTRNAGIGWMLYRTPTSVAFRAEDAGANVTSVAGREADARCLFTVVYDASGNQRLYVNRHLEDTDNVAGLGAITGVGFGINGRPDGSLDVRGSAVRNLVFYGAGLADIATDAWVANLAHYVLGSAAQQGAQGTFTRANQASWQNGGGVWHIAGSYMPMAGDEDGLRLQPGRVNTAYQNTDPQAADVAPALNWTGAVAPTAVDDSVALAAAGALEWGPNVFQYANSTGATQYIRMSAQTGNVNARCLQCLVRRTAGAGAVNLGLYNEVGGAFVAGAAINDGYGTRTLVHGQVPAAATCTMCLEVADATTIRWIAHDLSEGARCSAPVPNSQNAAIATRNVDDFTASDTERNDEGSFELTVTPLGWGGTQAGVVAVVNIAANPVVYVNAGGTWELDLDGTTQLDSGVAPVDGTANRIRVRWTDTFQSIDVDGTRVAGVYDGTLIGAGSWQLAADQDVAVTNFLTYRNGDG